MGTSPLPLPPVPPQIGIWAVLHEIRSEYSLQLTSLFLIIVGPGVLSLDNYFKKQKKSFKNTLQTSKTIHTQHASIVKAGIIFFLSACLQ